MENTEQGQSKIGIINFLQSLLTAVASFFLALLLLSIPAMIRGLHYASSQTGLTAVAGGFTENAFSPWFWLAFVVAFSWFYAAGRFSRSSLRIALFWIPALGISLCGVSVWIGFALLLSRASGH